MLARELVMIFPTCLYFELLVVSLFLSQGPGPLIIGDDALQQKQGLLSSTSSDAQEKGQQQA